jgi:hypothetical protein
LHALLEWESWEELSRLFFDEQWQFRAAGALLNLHCVDMKNFGGTNDLDYINILQCYFGYQLPEPGEVNAA